LVEFYAGETFRRVVVTSIPDRQQPKEIARTMYLDETPVQEKIDIAAAVFRERGSGRPTKRERRDMEKWRG
jgi:ribosome-associated heat shock protein Hsp15